MRGVGQVFEMAASDMATQRAYGVFWVAMTQQRAERWLFRKGTTQMRDYDKSAVDATAMSVKLRGPDNGKLPRTPYNIEQAITALFVEALDLDGESSAYRVMRELATAFSHHKGWEAGTHPSDQTQLEMDIGAATEMIVNMWQSSTESVSGEMIAGKVLSEFRDMDLVTKESLAAFIE